MRYWLVKSEPGAFSWDDLEQAPKRTTHWDGVRNYQARNMMRDDMKKGDLVFFYHSSAEPTGIIGICEVVKEAYPDRTAFDKEDMHFDPKSKEDAPIWYLVDLRAVRRFARVITLTELKEARALAKMALLQRGSRLSVQPVTEPEWKTVCALAEKPAPRNAAGAK